ncbi:MAG: sensor histidine kinase [Flavobacteriales bacterium]|nr:sensor histidine kinase [Flavobacteriales bacterium]
MPNRPLAAAVLVLVLFTGAGSATNASDTGDSLRFMLDADATAGERARALCLLSGRVLAHDPQTALAHALNAVRMAEMDGDRLLLHQALAAERVAQLRLGMVPEHLNSTLRSVDIARALGNAALLSTDLQELSQCYRDADRLEQAVEHARQALAITLPMRDALAIARAERFLMETLLRAGRHDELLRSTERALANTAALPSIEQARLRCLVARALLAQDRFSDALPHLVSAQRSIGIDGTPQDRFDLAMDMVAWAAHAGRIADGEAHLRDAERLMGELPAGSTSLPLKRARYSLAAAAKDWKNAHDLMVRIAQESDSAQRAGRHLALAGILMAHDQDAHEQDRDELAERVARSEAQLTDQLANNRALIAALAGLAVLSTALLVLARRHQRSAKRSKLKSAVIERQKEEIHARSLELQRQNMRLADTLMREERHGIALGEMHHRLKNNLQAIDSLLQMQCGALRDPAAERLLREASGRLRAMALVHQSIYRLGDDSALPLREQLDDLARNVLVAHGRHDRVSVSIDAQAIELNAAEMLPISLMVNELLTNSLKHAIAPNAIGSIRMVARAEGAALSLRYCDDSAMAAGSLREGSFGIELLSALAGQLNGSITCTPGLQTTFSLDLAPESLTLRKAS